MSQTASQSVFKNSKKSLEIETKYIKPFVELLVQLNVETLTDLTLSLFWNCVNGGDGGMGYNMVRVFPEYEAIVRIGQMEIDPWATKTQSQIKLASL